MTDKENKNIVMNFVEEFKNKANHGIIDQIFTDDFIHHLKLPNIPSDKEGTRMIGQMVAGAFPDVHVTIEDLLVDGDRVIERSVAKATHKGDFLGVPATNNPVSWNETHIYRISDGKIAEHWPMLDMFGLMNQINS